MASGQKTNQNNFHASLHEMIGYRTHFYYPHKMGRTFEKCITDIKNWMTTNKLKLYGEKTEIIILYNKSKHFPIPSKLCR